MKTKALVLLGKSISFLSRLTNRGNGSTWPGHIALLLDKNFVRNVVQGSNIKIVFIVGTNGKTTTARMIATILQKQNISVFQNESGANLVNGIGSALIKNADVKGVIMAPFAIFEVDENTLPLLLKQVTPYAVIVLNLFRDQLDRYGELDSIAKKWKTALASLPKSSKVLLNADDPLVAYLGESITADIRYFGLEEKSNTTILSHAADSIYCPRCATKLTYKKIFYSHLGDWKCMHCGLKRPNIHLSKFYYPLAGEYNKYNTLAAALFAREAGLDVMQIEAALATVTPAFGRQEKLVKDGKQIQIFLAKNPTGFNQNLQTVTKQGAKTVLLVLNDRIPDGRDVSWIWDIDIEAFVKSFEHIFVSGDRAYDMALRVQYADGVKKLYIEEILPNAINSALEEIPLGGTLYILPTYSAMLEVRKELTGKKIL